MMASSSDETNDMQPTVMAEMMRRVIGKTMRYWHHIGVIVFCLFLAACSGDNSKELLETAELEERQHNITHAKQLYEDLVRLYPNSPQAETARARLAALNKAP